MGKRVVLNVVKTIAMISAVVFWFCPLSTAIANAALKRRSSTCVRHVCPTNDFGARGELGEG